MTKNVKSTKNTKNTKNTRTIAMATVAAALAGALSIGTAAPALAQEPEPQQPATFAQDDEAADEGSWDATADESGFSADAAGDYAPELGATADDLAGMAGNGWWWRRVSPSDALGSAEDYFGVYSFDDWDYQVGRFRGTPAYRVEIVSDGGWWWQDGRGLDPDDDSNVIQCCGRGGGWSPWSGTVRYVAFVNYFTGRVMGAYVDYE